MADAIDKARPKVTASTNPNASRSLDMARTKVKQAQALLVKNQYEQAEALALDVKSWNMSFGIFEDNPDKVAAAARALRRRDQLRSSPPQEQPSLGVYDVLVQEARHLMSTGKLDQAAEKAQQAQRMNVVPPLSLRPRRGACSTTSKWPRVRQTPGSNPTAVASSAKPAAEAPSAIVEHEANELLARGDNVAATAKFTKPNACVLGKAGRCPPSTPRSRRSRPSSRKPSPGCPTRPMPIPKPPCPRPMPRLRPSQPMPRPPRPNCRLCRRRSFLRNPLPSRRPRMSRGEQILTEARALYGQGNYAAARQMAEEAKSGKHGVDPQADDLISQIAPAQQGGALSLYESALDALRKGSRTGPRPS